MCPPSEAACLSTFADMSSMPQACSFYKTKSCEEIYFMVQLRVGFRRCTGLRRNFLIFRRIYRSMSRESPVSSSSRPIPVYSEVSWVSCVRELIGIRGTSSARWPYAVNVYEQHGQLATQFDSKLAMVGINKSTTGVHCGFVAMLVPRILVLDFGKRITRSEH